jgi:branched-chain amino acid transport system ATP-binding protein
MDILRVENLAKNFGGLQILHGVSFAVEAGEKLALIGPNGAGKTTLLNVIGGQLAASGGRIVFDGKPITSLSPERRLHLGLARSYQINNLFFHLSVLDNILLALYGSEKFHFEMFRSLETRKDLLVEAQKLLETLGLWERRWDNLNTLSYGDQRLIELAFSLASKPKMVLLDEPSAGLPTAEAASFANIIRKLSVNTTLIFCAHDMDLVFNLADKIMVLYFGQILAKGLPQDIRANTQVQEIYLGTEETSQNARTG